jgi:hypothetical protein
MNENLRLAYGQVFIQIYIERVVPAFDRGVNSMM